MGSKPTPLPVSPETHATFVCGVIIVVATLHVAAVAYITKWWSLLVYCIPGVLVTWWWLYGKFLLFLALLVYRPRNIAGVFVTSDSPTWNEYIAKKWLEPYASRFVVLNWSEKEQWGVSLASCLFSKFCRKNLNFCPAVIFFRGLRLPLIFRFFYAFRDHKHGNDTALNTLEERLAQELERTRRR